MGRDSKFPVEHDDMTKKMRILDNAARASVVIPVWNGREYLPDCLSAVLSQDYSEFEVIVVDNGSTDGSAGFVAENYPDVRLIRSEYNLGFAGGCNLGLRAARGDILVLLNQDTRVHSSWLEALSTALQDPEVGVAGCKILYPDGETIQHAGGQIDWPLGLVHHYGRGERDVGDWDEPKVVDYVTGAAMAFRRDILEKVGLLDEEFWPGYFEDVDFCFRVGEAGYDVRYMPDAVLFHWESTSTDPSSVSRHYQRNRLRFVLKQLAPDRVLTEFSPAEELYQRSMTQANERRALRTAYLEGMLNTPSILARYWNADRWAIREVTAALAHLHHLAWSEDWGGVKDAAAMNENLIPQPEDSPRPTSITPLREFHFQSSVPVFGFLIARFRAFWYSIAARWAVRFLIQQQNAINQRREMYERQIVELSHENALLAKWLSMLAVSECEPDATDPNV